MQVKSGIFVATLVSVTLAACGSSSPVEVIVEPGITAIEQSSALACDADLVTLQTAIESFTLLNVDPPAAESDLVPNWLRSESTLYDLVDGQIVAAPDSGCAAAPAEPVAVAPVTTVDPVLVRACSIRFKTLRIAIEAYYAMNGTSVLPTEQALVDIGLLPEIDVVFDVDGSGNAVVAPGGVCDGVEVVEDTTTPLPDPGPDPMPVNLDACYTSRRTLEVAMEWYLEHNGAPATDESVLVAADILRRDIAGYDIVDGAIVPTPASICPPV
jgi:hypothetical protein